MNSKLKWFLRLIGIFVLVIILLAILVPVLYKKEIKEKLKQGINQEINGNFDFADISLSILKHFPRLSLSIENPVILSYEHRDTTMLFRSEKLDLDFDFWNVISKSEVLTIKAFYLIKPEINLISFPDSTANFNLLKSDPNVEKQNESPLRLILDHYEIKSGEIVLDDRLNRISVEAKNFNHAGSGNFKNNLVSLKTKTNIEALSYISSNLTLLRNCKILSELDLEIDQDSSIYSIQKGDFSINALKVLINGNLKLNVDGSNSLNLSIESPGTEFKELFSLIPNAYKGDFKDLQSTGHFNLKGKIAGILNTKQNVFPDWDFMIKVINGGIQYPGMSVSLEKVNMDLTTSNRGPDMDKAYIKINPFNFELNKNPIHGFLFLDQLMGNTHFLGEIKGVFSLDDYKKFMPLDEQVQLSGKLDCDFNFDLDKQMIDQATYDKMKVAGFLKINSLIYKDPSMPSIGIPNMELQFDNSSCVIKQSKILFGKSDIELNGILTNPFALIIDKGYSTGKISFNGKYLDVNEWMEENAPIGDQKNNIYAIPDTSSFVLDLIHKLEISFIGTYNKIVYDSYKIENAYLDGELKRDRIVLHSLKISVNNNPMSVTGVLESPMAYAMQNKTLKGSLQINGNRFDLVSFMGDEAPQGNSVSNGEPTSEPFVVPENMDLDLLFDIGTLVYDKWQLDKAKGLIEILDNEMQIHNFQTSTLGGNMVLNGIYNTSNPQKPHFDMKYDMTKLKFSKAYESIVSFKILAPIAKFIEGSFNSSIVFSGNMNKDMMPDFASLNVNGIIETLDGVIKGYKPLEQVAERLNIKELKSVSLQNTKNWFNIENGSVYLKPATKKVNDVEMIFSGSHKISGPMDYDFTFKIPRSKFQNNSIGSAAETGISFLKNLASKTGYNLDIGKNVNVLVNFSGKLLDPKINFKLLGTDGKSLEDEAKNTMNDAVDKAKDSLMRKAESELEKEKQKVIKETKRIEDSIRVAISKKTEEEKKKILEKAAKEAEKYVDSNLLNKGKDVLNEKLGKEADKILKEGGQKEVEQIKDKVQEWNPFKKKK